ncbi:hypothetical protein AJ80_08670 [Polytolypa hystricis UAMH7299]|uniref:DNA endonuclease activator Ctp1 C-terminal domain-containing protein n=1 Tax=Polytolypa hystricis (strain UAMH7299) TaxID=1447883 RepID=A0A2B7X452_POLH7|nr:hypothetical protein AJ80_08670 [Polytolypa hystricis UAMH7299]
MDELLKVQEALAAELKRLGCAIEQLRRPPTLELPTNILDKTCERCYSNDSRIESLEQNNIDLQQRLDKLQKLQVSSPEETEDGQSDLLTSRKDYAPDLVIRDFSDEQPKPSTIPFDCYDKLARLYGDLFQENENLRQSFKAVKKKLHSSKTKNIAWNGFVKGETFDINVDGERISFQRVRRVGHDEHSITTPNPTKHGSKSSFESTHPMIRHTNREFPPMLHKPTLLRMDSESRHVRSQNHVHSAPDSQPIPYRSPEDERAVNLQETGDAEPELPSSDPGPTQTQDPQGATDATFPSSDTSSDIPVVVAARPVKRNSRASRWEKEAAAAAYDNRVGAHSRTRIIKVKSESDSTSVLEVMSPLDEGNQPGSESSLNESCITKTGRQAQKSTLDPENVYPRISAAPCKMQTPILSKTEYVSSNWQATGSKRRPALQPMDTNTPTVRRFHEKTPGTTSKKRKISSRGAEAVPTVAEDGEEYAGRRDKNRLGRSPASNPGRETAATVTPAQNRLLDLLGTDPGPKPMLRPLHSAHTEPTHEELAHRTPGNANVANQYLLAKTGAQNGVSLQISRANMCSPQTEEISEHSTDSTVCPDDEPYRVRPLHRLGLQHFKLNPERNQGLDYAFDEVVRQRSERKCLPGCVRQDCCGPKFRAMAMLKDAQTSATDLSLEALGQEDRQILEEYLGNNKNILGSIASEELRELLLDAQARHLANQYGRHRHAHGRAPSPPGYWRTDMPSTQELERDRREAKEREREKVAERYREAMRLGGLWKFADE